MRSQNRYFGIDKTITKQVQYHAWRLKKMQCFCNDGVEDIEQDLFYEIFDAISKYDESKSKLSTFVSQIIVNRSHNMIQRKFNMKHGQEYKMLDHINSDGESLIHTIIDTDYSERDANAAIDVQTIITKLPNNLQKISALLKLYSITETAQMTGKSRTSIYRILEKLKGYFQVLYSENKLTNSHTQYSNK